MKKKLDCGMLIYSVLMTLLFLAEFVIPYHPGKMSILLYSITPVKFLLCLYMINKLNHRIIQGEPFGTCKKFLVILACVFVLDFLVNLIFTIPFPRSYEAASYAFFMIISMIEFALNAFVIWHYSRTINATSEAKLWLWINIAITIVFFIIFCKTYSEYEIGDKWTNAVLLLFLCREPLKIRIGLLREKVSAA